MKTGYMLRWAALHALLGKSVGSVRLTWPELASIVGGLPPSASNHRAWWSGDRPHVRAWRSAGYTVANLVPGKEVTFVRVTAESAPTAESPVAATSARADLLLITCVKSKRAVPSAARDLYTSPLFQKQRKYAEGTGVRWFILSAEHALVGPDEWLAPYERYLPDTPAGYRAAWGVWAVERLELLTGPLAGRVVEVHAGAPYVEAIAPHLAAKGATLLEPLYGLTMGERLAWYNSHSADDAPGADDEPLVDAADYVRRLCIQTAALTPHEFLALQGTGLRLPGLYSWWVDAAGAADLSRGLGQPVDAGLIYAGLAGATRWPSVRRSTNTLWSRIVGMHLGGNHEFSTFRRTLGSILSTATDSPSIDEGALTGWMHDHLRVVAVPSEDPDTLGRLEDAVLKALDPPLNLQGMVRTPIRLRLTELRSRYR